jgi:hypothetical protein
MTKKILLILLLNSVLLLSACNGTPVQTVEVTRLVPQTSVVTQIVTETPRQTEISGNLQDQATGVSQAEIALIQFYTLLNYHLYQEAYQFISLSWPGGVQSYDRWVRVMETIKSVKITGLSPINEYAKRFGYPIYEDEPGFSTLSIQVMQDLMMGSTISSDSQHFFVKMKLENGLWKIYSFQTNVPTNKQ